MSITGALDNDVNQFPSFAQELRDRSDEDLTKLLSLRPDLITPVPADMTALSTRATSAPSLLRAL